MRTWKISNLHAEARFRLRIINAIFKTNKTFIFTILADIITEYSVTHDVLKDYS